MTVGLRAAAVSDVGRRPVNQDAAFTATWGAAVADGVGGGPGGDIASALLLHRLVAGLRGPLELDDFATRLRIANWDLRAHVEQYPDLEGMATTFTGVFLSPAGTILLAHAGDSRAYLLRDGAMSRETRDDSFVQLLIDSGVVHSDEVAGHPHGNVITASMRGGDDDRIAVGERPARPGDRWLLCSDGISDYLTDAEICDALVGMTPEAAARALVELALHAGSRDNVTAVVADVVSGPAAGDEPAFAGSAADRFTETLDDLDDLESA